MEGWYYLHENSDLIYKPEHGGTAADIRDSDFARGLWPMDPADRAGAWRIVVEGLAAGANAARVKELAVKWGCTDDDGLIYAERIGAVVRRDGNQWMATRKDFTNIQESPVGFGTTVYQALAELAKALGYKPSKMWGTSFKDLLTVRQDKPMILPSGAAGDVLASMRATGGDLAPVSGTLADVVAGRAE